MATVDGYTAAYMQVLRDQMVIHGHLDGDDLVLVQFDETEINLGPVVGTNGTNGTNGTDGDNGANGTHGTDGINVTAFERITTTPYTISGADVGKMLEFDFAGANELYIDDLAGNDVPEGGCIRAVCYGAYATEVTNHVSNNVYARNTWKFIDGPGGQIQLIKAEGNLWYLFGDLAATA